MTVVVTLWPQCYNKSHSGSVLSTPSHTTQRNLCNLSERTYVLRRTCMIWRRLRTKFILFIGIVLQWSSSIWLYISPKMRFWSPSILAFPFVLVWAEQQPELPGESILNLYLPLPSNWSNTPTAALLILQSITIGQYQVKVLEISSLAQLPLIMVGCMVRTPCLFHPSSQQLSTFAKPQSLLSSLSLLWRWLKRKV